MDSNRLIGILNQLKSNLCSIKKKNLYFIFNQIKKIKIEFLKFL